MPSFRAYDTVTEWRGPIRADRETASKDALQHNRDLRTAGGFGSAAVIMPDPECPGRAVDAFTGDPVWPPHGRSQGSVLFGEE